MVPLHRGRCPRRVDGGEKPDGEQREPHTGFSHAPGAGGRRREDDGIFPLHRRGDDGADPPVSLERENALRQDVRLI